MQLTPIVLPPLLRQADTDRLPLLHKELDALAADAAFDIGAFLFGQPSAAPEGNLKLYDIGQPEVVLLFRLAGAVGRESPTR